MPVEEWFAEEEARDPGFRDAIEEVAARSRIALMVKETRKNAGLTQDQVAERTGIRQPHIARAESGRHMPKIDVLMRIARACGTELVIEMRPKLPPKVKKQRDT